MRFVAGAAFAPGDAHRAGAAVWRTFVDLAGTDRIEAARARGTGDLGRRSRWQKGLQLAETLKKGIFEEYDYYQNLSPAFKAAARKQMRSKPMEYALVVSAVTEAYKTLGQKEKAYTYLLKSIEPIDKKFSVFIKGLQQMGKEKAIKESENVRQIAPFYQYLFNVMEPFDSAYSRKKEIEITNAMMKATQ